MGRLGKEAKEKSEQMEEEEKMRKGIPMSSISNSLRRERTFLTDLQLCGSMLRLLLIRLVVQVRIREGDSDMVLTIIFNTSSYIAIVQV